MCNVWPFARSAIRYAGRLGAAFKQMARRVVVPELPVPPVRVEVDWPACIESARRLTALILTLVIIAGQTAIIGYRDAARVTMLSYLEQVVAIQQRLDEGGWSSGRPITESEMGGLISLDESLRQLFERARAINVSPKAESSAPAPAPAKRSKAPEPALRYTRRCAGHFAWDFAGASCGFVVTRGSGHEAVEVLAPIGLPGVEPMHVEAQDVYLVQLDWACPAYVGFRPPALVLIDGRKDGGDWRVVNYAGDRSGLNLRRFVVRQAGPRPMLRWVERWGLPFDSDAVTQGWPDMARDTMAVMAKQSGAPLPMAVIRAAIRTLALAEGVPIPDPFDAGRALRSLRVKVNPSPTVLGVIPQRTLLGPAFVLASFILALALWHRTRRLAWARGASGPWLLLYPVGPAERVAAGLGEIAMVAAPWVSLEAYAILRGTVVPPMWLLLGTIGVDRPWYDVAGILDSLALSGSPFKVSDDVQAVNGVGKGSVQW